MNQICFKFNPDMPDLIAVGMETGQVAVFDLVDVRKEQAKVDEANAHLSDEHEEPKPFLHPPKGVSFVERSHEKSVADVRWMPVDLEVVDKKVCSVSPPEEYHTQIVSAGEDGKLLFWDMDTCVPPQLDPLLPPVEKEKSDSDDEDEAANQKKKAPEHAWLPVHHLTLELPTSKAALAVQRVELESRAAIALVTEEGIFARGFWGILREADTKDGDAGAPAAGNSDNKGDAKERFVGLAEVASSHELSCRSLAISPHFDDIYLTVGDWSFAIWKAGMKEPLFRSPYASCYLVCGEWSPTRPAVVFTAKVDGSIDVWDLLDQSHDAVLKDWSVASCALSSLRFWQSPNRSTQYLAAGDDGGTLHVLEIPRAYRRRVHKEAEQMSSFLTREDDRVAYSKDKTVTGSSTGEKTKDAPGLGGEGFSPLDTPKIELTEEDEAAEDEFKKMVAKFEKELCASDES